MGQLQKKRTISKNDGAQCSDVGVSRTTETRRETKYQEANKIKSSSLALSPEFLEFITDTNYYTGRETWSSRHKGLALGLLLLGPSELSSSPPPPP